MTFTPGEPVEIGEEAQGAVGFDVIGEDAAGFRRTVRVCERTREAALDAAWQRTGHGRLLQARVRFECLGQCLACGVPIFRDNNLRPSGNGWKCRDCP